MFSCVCALAEPSPAVRESRDIVASMALSSATSGSLLAAALPVRPAGAGVRAALLRSALGCAATRVSCGGVDALAFAVAFALAFALTSAFAAAVAAGLTVALAKRAACDAGAAGALAAAITGASAADVATIVAASDGAAATSTAEAAEVSGKAGDKAGDKAGAGGALAAKGEVGFAACA